MMFLLLERRQTIQKNNRINYCKYMVRNFFFLLIILFVSACKFFDESWIHATITRGKSPGAFSASTIPEVHPYILLNYK